MRLEELISENRDLWEANDKLVEKCNKLENHSRDLHSQNERQREVITDLESKLTRLKRTMEGTDE